MPSECFQKTTVSTRNVLPVLTAKDPWIQPHVMMLPMVKYFANSAMPKILDPKATDLGAVVYQPLWPGNPANLPMIEFCKFFFKILQRGVKLFVEFSHYGTHSKAILSIFGR